MRPIRTLVFLLMPLTQHRSSSFDLVVFFGLNQLGGTSHGIHIFTMMGLIIIQPYFLFSRLGADILDSTC